ncbi:hypothetical protein QA633_43715 [Bradyrhizobium barranii]|uniref:hypothetical protein n=1 Tax=Bradyrhizobium barranii TaxID=2992140 RepID=UPI0024AE9A26|nr:hypothetical protein [Bradyrhizobium barranii]WFT95081.1 hypothetical protein QA633_43715 [Bradyrhizobium barranii]
MSKEPRKVADLPYKDFVVVAPLCGSLLAIAWEIGSFQPVGLIAFGSFSLAEHLTFALPALPVAFACFLLPMTMMTIGTIGRLRRSLRLRSTTSRLVAAAIFSAGLSISGLAGVETAALTVKGSIPWVLSLAVSFFGPVLVIVLLSDLSTNAGRYISLCWIVIYASFLAFAIGQAQCVALLKDGAPTEIETEAGKLKLTVFRASASALIGVEPGTKHVVLIKGDRIRERRWDTR